MSLYAPILVLVDLHRTLTSSNAHQTSKIVTGRIEVVQVAFHYHTKKGLTTRMLTRCCCCFKNCKSVQPTEHKALHSTAGLVTSLSAFPVFARTTRFSASTRDFLYHKRIFFKLGRDLFLFKNASRVPA